MNRSELEKALRSAGDLAHEQEFIIFGSQAILGLISRPPKRCLVSMELDIYPKNNYRSVPILIKGLGRRSTFFKRNGYFLDCVSPELATLPEGWTERLIPFQTKNTGGVTGWCVELHDLVVSKLAASRPKDLEYIEALLGRKLVRSKIVAERIGETATNEATRNDMRMTLAELVKAAKKREKRSPRQ